MKQNELAKILMICFNLKSSKISSLALFTLFELSLPMLLVYGNYNVFNFFSAGTACRLCTLDSDLQIEDKLEWLLPLFRERNVF